MLCNGCVTVTCCAEQALELGRFVDKCQNSLQLALSRAELPLLQVLESLHTPAEVLAYLQVSD